MPVSPSEVIATFDRHPRTTSVKIVNRGQLPKISRNVPLVQETNSKDPGLHRLATPQAVRDFLEH